jgi:hypothetical protein
MEFVKSPRVGNTVFIALRGSYAHERFLPVEEYGGGGRKGLVIIP